MVLIIWASTRVMLGIIRVPQAVLMPIVLVLCAIGAYALNNTMDAVWVLLIFGVVGYVLVKAGFPLPPLILGLVLGDQIEINLVRAIMTDDNLWLVPPPGRSPERCSRSRSPPSSRRSGSTTAAAPPPRPPPTRISRACWPISCSTAAAPWAR